MKSRKFGLILSYGYFIVSTIVSIFLSSFVVRTIGKTNYGIYQSVAAFIGYLTLLEFGTGRIMSRNLSLLKKDGTEGLEIKKIISTVYLLNWILTVVILCISVVFWLLLDVIYQNSMTVEQVQLAKILFIFPVISLIVSFFQQMYNGALIGYENYTFEKIVSCIKLIMRAVIIVLALLKSNNILVYAIIDSTINFIVLCITIFYCRTKMHMPVSIRFFDKTVFKLILPLCLAMMLQSLVTTMNGTLDKFLISIMLTPEDVTIYSVAMTIFSMFSTIACLPISMFMPKVASDMRSGLRGKELTESLVAPTRLNIIITGLIAFGFVVLGKQFVVILYGKEFIVSWICAMIVIFPMFFNSCNDIILNVLDVLRKRHVRSLILMATTAINFGLTLIGIKLIGMSGAAVATGVATSLQVVALNFYYHRYIGIDIIMLFKKGFKGILLSLIVSTMVTMPLLFVVKNVYASFILCAGVFVIIFLFTFYFFGSEKIEKEYIRNFIQKILKGQRRI